MGWSEWFRRANVVGVVTVAYWVVCAFVLPVLLGGVVLGEAVARTGVEEPVGMKVAAVSDGGRTVYTYPELATWRRKVAGLVMPSTVTLLGMAGVVVVMRRRAEGTGEWESDGL